MVRQEYYHDPDAPPANSLAPTAFAAVRDDAGCILLVRRADTGNWELPGGRVELGVYSDPGHVMVYPATGEARQQFAVCFHGRPVEGGPQPDHDETCEAAWVHPRQVPRMPMHPSMRRRISDALSRSRTPHTG